MEILRSARPRFDKLTDKQDEESSREEGNLGRVVVVGKRRDMGGAREVMGWEGGEGGGGTDIEKGSAMESGKAGRERERETERQRQRETETETETLQTDRDRQTDR